LGRKIKASVVIPKIPATDFADWQRFIDESVVTRKTLSLIVSNWGKL
jgi:hypothetical protein